MQTLSLISMMFFGAFWVLALVVDLTAALGEGSKSKERSIKTGRNLAWLTLVLSLTGTAFVVSEGAMHWLQGLLLVGGLNMFISGGCVLRRDRGFKPWVRNLGTLFLPLGLCVFLAADLAPQVESTQEVQDVADDTAGSDSARPGSGTGDVPLLEGSSTAGDVAPGAAESESRNAPETPNE